MKQDYLLPSPPAPAIREAMAKAVQRKDKGLDVYDFSSGNIGNLLVNQPVFSKMDVVVGDSVLPELRPVVEGLRDGIVASYYPTPRGVANERSSAKRLEMANHRPSMVRTTVTTELC